MTLIEKVARAIWLAEPGSGTALGGDYDSKTKEFYEQRHAKSAIAVVLKDLIDARQFDSSFIEYYARTNGIEL